MDGTFACPECGCEICLRGLSPGRQVVCDWCKSLVEVPYIPRADQIKRMRRDRTRARAHRLRLPAWAWAVAGLLSVAIVLASVGRVVVGRWQSAEAATVAQLVESSRAAAGAGH